HHHAEARQSLPGARRLHDSAATPCVPLRHSEGHGCGSAAESGEVGDGGVDLVVERDKCASKIKSLPEEQSRFLGNIVVSSETKSLPSLDNVGRAHRLAAITSI